jgi:hypothetical protein
VTTLEGGTATTKLVQVLDEHIPEPDPPERGGVTCARLGATVLSRESRTSVCPDLAGEAASTRRRFAAGCDGGRRRRRCCAGDADARPCALLYASCSGAHPQ